MCGDVTRKPWRLRLRESVAYAAVLAVLSLFGLFAWMTRQPEAPFFDRAAALPYVGDVVTWTRDRFVAPAPGETPSSGGAGRARSGSRDVTTDEPSLLPEREFIGIGAAMRARPRSEAQLLGRTTRLESYEVLERAGTWVLVVASSRRVWIDLAAERVLMPPLGNEPLPPGPLHPRQADPELLAVALELMGEDEVRREAFEPYELLTDVIRPRLIERLRELSQQVESAYFERYGVEPIGVPRESVVLFRSQKDYEQFRDAIAALVGIKSHGFQSRGLVAFFVEGRSDAEVEGTFVHELVHLLNRRAIGPALPAWLAEGLADELALFSGPAARERSELIDVVGPEIRYRGWLAGLKVLRDEARGSESLGLAALISSEPEAFLSAPNAAALYLRSAFFVHFLLEDESLRPGFHTFLDQVRSGRQPTADHLLESLGVQLQELEQRFGLFLIGEGLKAGV